MFPQHQNFLLERFSKTVFKTAKWKQMYQQTNLEDLQRVLETDSTDGTTTVPLHWTCPTGIHVDIHGWPECKPLHLLGGTDSHNQQAVLN